MRMVMLSSNREIPPIVGLRYRGGELIIKEGDYGISIYKIIKGIVEIFHHAEDKDITLTHLRPGEIFGEMAFFNSSDVILNSFFSVVSTITGVPPAKATMGG